MFGPGFRRFKSRKEVLNLIIKQKLVGIEVLKQFRGEVDTLEAERQELASAERLFDLSITMYPELLHVQKEMKGLEQIYKLYEEQTVREPL